MVAEDDEPVLLRNFLKLLFQPAQLSLVLEQSECSRKSPSWRYHNKFLLHADVPPSVGFEADCASRRFAGNYSTHSRMAWCQLQLFEEDLGETTNNYGPNIGSVPKVTRISAVTGSVKL